MDKCCIVSNFYIKSQQLISPRYSSMCCIVSNFYIKSQQNASPSLKPPCCIVSNFLHQITTNTKLFNVKNQLYSIQFLHQITTAVNVSTVVERLYSIQFLHQITTPSRYEYPKAELYSIQFLHQITTSGTTLIDYKGITFVCAAKKAMFGELRKSIRCSFSVLQNKYIKKIPVVEVFRDRRVRPCPRNFKISPYCLSVTLRMLVIPEGGIDLRIRRIWTSIFSLETQCRT